MLRWLAARRRTAIWLLPRQHEVQILEVMYRRVGEQELLARVYRPAQATAFAAVLDVHGGDWVGGDRFQQEILDRSLAGCGVLVAAIDYRLAPRDRYPAALEDVLAGIDWLTRCRLELGALPEAAVGLLGSSAGGHLALLAALQGEVAFAIADAPVSDSVADLQERGPHPFWPDPSAAIEGSPLLRVQRGEFAQLPPLLITHGDRDEAVPLSMSEHFVRAYRAAGGTADLEIFRGLGHAFVLTHPRGQASKLLARRMLAFITAHAHPS